VVIRPSLTAVPILQDQPGIGERRVTRNAGHGASHQRVGRQPVVGLARHLADRIHGNIGFTELNIHSLWSLIRLRPDLAPPLAADLDTRIARLLDENQVSTSARGELEALRYGIAITTRN
jgi:hypothetical protein